MALKIISADFIKGAVAPEDFPKIGAPEFAFFGRSNAGKSTLINLLTNRKKLVKTGSRPGMTREVNFFAVNKPASFQSAGKVYKNVKGFFVLTDLPGYGYAKVSGGEARQIDKMLYDYCTCRKELKLIFFLTDIRREAGSTEFETVEFFRSLNIETVIAATKCDKIGKNDIIKAKARLAEFFRFPPEKIIETSSLKKNGREKILKIIEEKCNEEKSL